MRGLRGTGPSLFRWSRVALYVPVEVRFWRLVDVRGPSECWPWIGYVNPATGYGQFEPFGQTITAHRFALELTLGEELGSDDACHECDNPPCCNPAHLFRGSRSDNVLDAYRKGRWRGNLPMKKGAA